ncbi:GNAT family N-acetyltransferase [Arthrobacter sp. HLT1-20]
MDSAGQLTVGLEPEAVSEAAEIWARAKARRDHDLIPVSTEATMPGILRRLGIDGARLLMARRDGAAAGFTLLAPREETLEIFYLAVADDSWGTGVGRLLLSCAEEYAQGIGCTSVELWVISTNERAINIYERAGFAGSGQVQRDATTGQTELLLLKQCGSFSRPL